MTARPTTTRRALLRLRAALLALTVLTLITSTWSFVSIHAVLDTVRDQTAPAVLDVSSARSALTLADAAAVDSFRGGGAKLAGPGEQYETGLAVANQDLARAAEDNAAGEVGSRELQVIAGLLTDYSGWISQADTHFRGANDAALTAVDLWYAARSLRGADQVVPHLDMLAADQRLELDRQLSTGWLNPVTGLAWALPALALLVLLGLTQVFLWRRFRRRFNEWLVAATLMLLGLMVATSVGLVLIGRGHIAATQLDDFVAASDRRSDAMADAKQNELVEMVRAQCSVAGATGCGVTLPAGGPTTAPPPAPTVTDVPRFTDATGFRWLTGLIPAGGVAIAGLVVLGLRPRIDEYRYRP